MIFKKEGGYEGKIRNFALEKGITSIKCHKA